MPSYGYTEDADLDLDDLTEADVRACDDVAELEQWSEDLDALMADIRGQLEGYCASGIENLQWVYSACRKMGFLGRGQTRIKRRLKQLGVDQNPLGDKIHDLNVKLATVKAEAAVAREFMRLATEQLPISLYRAIEVDAEAAVERRAAKAIQRAAA